MTLKFKIYRNLYKVKKDRTGYIKLKNKVLREFQNIQNSWNNTETTEKGKRGQVILSQSDTNAVEWKKRLMEVGELEGRTFKECHVLFSDSGCKEQQFHHDYDPEELKKKDLLVKPRIALLALEKDTTLNLYDKELEKIIVVSLDRGDCLIFDADALHSGSEYNKVNVRLHAYLDVPGIEREPGKIWPLDNTRQNEMKEKKRVTSDKLYLGTVMHVCNADYGQCKYYDGTDQQMFAIMEKSKEILEGSKTSYDRYLGYDNLERISKNFALCSTSLIELSKKRKREQSQYANVRKLQKVRSDIEKLRKEEKRLLEISSSVGVRVTL